jgi:hypothetical protein
LKRNTLILWLHGRQEWQGQQFAEFLKRFTRSKWHRYHPIFIMFFLPRLSKNGPIWRQPMFKLMSLLMFAVTLQAQAQEVSLYRTFLQWDAAQQENVWQSREGFHDDIPQVQGLPRQQAVSMTRFCYRGEAQQLCPMITHAAAASYAFYMQGDHWGIYLRSCEMEGSEMVRVHYTIIDDYAGDADVMRIITPCP